MNDMAQKAVVDKNSRYIMLADAKISEISYFNYGANPQARMNYLVALISSMKRGEDGEGMIKKSIENLSASDAPLSREIAKDLVEIMASTGIIRR